VMDRMREAKKSGPKESGETTSHVGKPKRKNHKGSTHSSPRDLKDVTSTVTLEDNVPEIVSEPSDQKNSAQNAANTPAPLLPRTHKDGGEEPAAGTNTRRREKLEWYGSWEDD